MKDFEISVAICVGILTICGIVFSIFWKIIIDVKKSFHSRVDRLEEKVDFKVSKNGLDSFKEGFTAQHIQLSNTVQSVNNEMHLGFGAVHARIDTLILAIKNGKE